MALPSLYSISTGKSIQTAFGGLNESYACAEAEFTEMKNFSSRGYPALQTRTPRRTMRAMGRCNGMYHLNGLLTVCGQDLVYTPDEAPAQPVTVKMPWQTAARRWWASEQRS